MKQKIEDDNRLTSQPIFLAAQFSNNLMSQRHPAVARNFMIMVMHHLFINV